MKQTAPNADDEYGPPDHRTSDSFFFFFFTELCRKPVKKFHLSSFIFQAFMYIQYSCTYKKRN